jgi:hypothetical protein
MNKQTLITWIEDLGYHMHQVEVILVDIDNILITDIH